MKNKNNLMNILKSVNPPKDNPWKPGMFLEKQFETLLSEGLQFKILRFSDPIWSSNLKPTDAFDMEVKMSQYLNHAARFKDKRKKLGNHILLKGVPFESTFNKVYNEQIRQGKIKLGELDEKGKKIRWHFSRTEFVVICNRFPGGIRIECKDQDVYGSTDQKLLGLYRDLEKMPEPKIVVLYGGNGRRAGCLESLHADIVSLNEKYDDKHFEVVKKENLIAWIINTL